MRTVTIHQPECLPWLGFVDKARQADVFVLLDCVQYRKDYFQNRNRIRTATGWTWLTVPVASHPAQTLIRDVEIADDGGRWRRKHLARWKDSYRLAPHAGEVLPFLEQLYGRPFRWLVDFNHAVIVWLFEQFQVKAEVRLASELPHRGAASELNLSLCQATGADVYLSGVSGREYLDEAPFREAGIRVRYQEFQHPTYTQQFEPFVPAMSALDLVLNHGPASSDILGLARQASTEARAG